MHCSVLKDSKMGTLPHATALFFYLWGGRDWGRIGHFLMEKGILKKQQNLEMKIWGIRPSLIFINICYTFTIFTLHKDYLYFCLIVLFSRFLHQNIQISILMQIEKLKMFQWRKYWLRRRWIITVMLWRRRSPGRHSGTLSRRYLKMKMGMSAKENNSFIV